MVQVSTSLDETLIPGGAEYYELAPGWRHEEVT